MWKTTPFTVFFLLALMPWLDPPGVLLFKWDWGNSSAILVSALLGFLLQWSGALALGLVFCSLLSYKDKLEFNSLPVLHFAVIIIYEQSTKT